MGHCDTMNDHKLIINHCDLYLMLESFWGYIKAAFQSRTALFVEMFSSTLLYALVSRCLFITCKKPNMDSSSWSYDKISIPQK